jgi:hypothetical protein
MQAKDVRLACPSVMHCLHVSDDAGYAAGIQITFALVT